MSRVRATGRMRVTITTEDIAAGKRSEPEGCPLALALSNLGFRRPQVFDTRWYHDDSYLSWPLSERARDFVSAFDHGFSVEPVTLYIQGPR